MKKLIVFCMTLFISTLMFAQSYSAKCSPLFGVVSAAANVKDATYEIIDYDSEKDLTVFTYTWMTETKILLTKSYTQYKCLLSVTSGEDNGEKKLVIDISNDILYRAVNADGSKKTGVPNIKGVTYEWAKNTTIVNKKTVLNSVVDVVKQQLYAELNKTEDEITKGMIKFFSDDLNLVLFDSDSIGKIASDYLSLCSVPTVLAKLEKEKNDIWFENYQEKIKGAKFDNTFKVSNVKKSDVEGFKYIVECSTFYTTFLKEDFNKLVESSKAGYELANMEMGIRELRKRTFDAAKSAYQELMYIKFYTNNDAVLDLNNKSEFHVSGILHKVDIAGALVKQIHVYEN